MKRVLYTVLTITLVGLLGAGGTLAYLDHWKYMNAAEAQKRWGSKLFDPESFKKGSASQRATQAADLLKKQSFVGKSADEVVATLGETSGYFWSDRFPTYFIEEGWTQKKDSWQLVFLLDSQNKVSEVRIHKNCCYAKLPWTL